MNNTMTKNIYIIDTCSFRKIDLPPDIFISMWKNIENLAKEGRFISHKLVLEEIREYISKKDVVNEWAEKHKDVFKEVTLQQTKLIKEILATDNFCALIDLNATKGQADPFIIAMAMEKEEQHLLSGEEIKKIVITEEGMNPKHPNKIRIPFVCGHFRITCKNIFDLFRMEGWKW